MITTPTREEKAAELLAGLQQHHSSGELFRYSPFGMQYTEGIEYLAEQAGAYWLIEVVASHQIRKAIRSNPRLQQFQLWQIVVNDDRTAVVTCREDSGMRPAVRQKIEYTDFPLDQFEWYFENGVMLLKSEH